MAQVKRSKPQFANKEKVLLIYNEDWKETKFVHKRTWREGIGWVYNVGSMAGVTHRGGLATVAEASLDKHP